MEASNERLIRDTVGGATRQEIEYLKRENIDLKQLVANRSTGSKNGHPCLRRSRGREKQDGYDGLGLLR